LQGLGIEGMAFVMLRYSHRLAPNTIKTNKVTHMKTCTQNIRELKNNDLMLSKFYVYSNVWDFPFFFKRTKDVWDIPFKKKKR
jgi:hypothetical protein